MNHNLARVKGIEPLTTDLESIILPLNYTHIMGAEVGFEPTLQWL